MENIGIIKWNSFQLSSLKRDLLLFDNLVHDVDQYNLWLNFVDVTYDYLHSDKRSLFNEINATIEYLGSTGNLKQISSSALYSGERMKVITDDDILNELYNLVLEQKRIHIESVEGIKSTSYSDRKQSILTAYDLFHQNEDNKLRFLKTVLSKINNHQRFYPIIQNLNNNNIGQYETALKVTLSNIPIPSDQVPLDEILDFKKEHILKYKRLMRWAQDLGKTEKSELEMQQELEYLTLEFENRMKLEKEDYQLSTTEAILSFPVEMIENIIKFNWSKIPKQIIKFRKNKIKLLISETKAPGKEISYLSYANKAFKVNST